MTNGTKSKNLTRKKKKKKWRRRRTPPEALQRYRLKASPPIGGGGRGQEGGAPFRKGCSNMERRVPDINYKISSSVEGGGGLL
jgi:hypothetical protein